MLAMMSVKGKRYFCYRPQCPDFRLTWCLIVNSNQDGENTVSNDGPKMMKPSVVSMKTERNSKV